MASLSNEIRREEKATCSSKARQDWTSGQKQQADEAKQEAVSHVTEASGAIQAEKDGRRYLYSPLLKRRDWVLQESRGLLDRLFDGRVAPLVAHFSEQRKLSRKDIAELRKLLEELDDGKQ